MTNGETIRIPSAQELFARLQQFDNSPELTERLYPKLLRFAGDPMPPGLFVIVIIGGMASIAPSVSETLKMTERIPDLLQEVFCDNQHALELTVTYFHELSE